MRHRIKGRKLGRTRSHRISTLRSLATALIIHKKITTTLAKAKEAKRFIEPLITKAKDNSVHSRRLVSNHIKDRGAVTELFTEIAEKVGDRPGGYTRVVKLGTRVGDAAEMAILELVDFNELVSKKSKKAKPKAEKAETDEQETEKQSAPANAEIEEAEVVEETEVKDEAAEEVKEEESEVPAEIKAEEKNEELKEKPQPDKSAEAEDKSEKKEDK